MSSDSRVQRLDNFTSTQHSNIYPEIDPSNTPFASPCVVCVIGASRGIGAGVAYAYARAGASDLVLAGRKSSRQLNDAVAEKCRRLGRCSVSVVDCDITSSADVALLRDTIKTSYNRLDIVVINSGYSGPVTLKVTEEDPAMFANVTNINYIGTFHTLHYLIPLLLDTTDGRKAFIAISSFAAGIVKGIIANSKYCISKLAQARLIEHAAAQFDDQGLLTLNVHPGAVASELALETAPEDFKKYLVDDAGLAGALCTWLTRDTKKMRWLSGRLVSATWDVSELMAKKEEVTDRDLLKFAATV